MQDRLRAPLHLPGSQGSPPVSPDALPLRARPRPVPCLPRVSPSAPRDTHGPSPRAAMAEVSRKIPSTPTPPTAYAETPLCLQEAAPAL